MAPSVSPTTHDGAPSIVRRLNPLVVRLLRLGVPMGPNVLITIRGRRTGLLRTFPVATLEADGRQYLFSPFGEVAWVHNLRADGRAMVGRGRRRKAVRASELSVDIAAQRLEAGLKPTLRFPLLGPMIAGWYGINARSSAADYLEAARRHPGFELRQVPDDDGGTVA